MRRSTLSAREQTALDTLTTVGDLRKHVRAVVTAMDLRCVSQPYHVAVIYGARSAEEQTRLYAQGRTAPGAIVTRARAGESPHNFAAAADVALLWDAPRGGWLPDAHEGWRSLAQLVRDEGLVSGADFRGFADLAHMELRDWVALSRTGALTLWHGSPATGGTAV